MIDQDVLRKAVEYAKGWRFFPNPHHESGGEICPPYGGDWWLDELPSMFLDALAAQLVRQVDALDTAVFECDVNGRARVLSKSSEGLPHWGGQWSERGPDRTENTITAIVQAAEGEAFRAALVQAQEGE